MIPREAIRPLLRLALAEAHPSGPDASRLTAVGDGPEPLEALVRYCEQLLPLPPFEVWMEDVTVHPGEHLEDLDESADTPTAADPMTLDTRPLDYRSEAWTAHLRGFRDGPAWKGYITFEQRATRQLCRTSLIFREHDANELRERFESFENAALEAFLRSALP